MRSHARDAGADRKLTISGPMLQLEEGGRHHALCDAHLYIDLLVEEMPDWPGMPAAPVARRRGGSPYLRVCPGLSALRWDHGKGRQSGPVRRSLRRSEGWPRKRGPYPRLAMPISKRAKSLALSTVKEAMTLRPCVMTRARSVPLSIDISSGQNGETRSELDRAGVVFATGAQS